MHCLFTSEFHGILRVKDLFLLRLFKLLLAFICNQKTFVAVQIVNYGAIVFIYFSNLFLSLFEKPL